MNYILARASYLNNTNTYGNRWLLGWGKPVVLAISTLCIITPGTNWALFYVKKIWNKKLWVNQK